MGDFLSATTTPRSATWRWWSLESNFELSRSTRSDLKQKTDGAKLWVLGHPSAQMTAVPALFRSEYERTIRLKWALPAADYDFVTLSAA